MVKSVLSMKEFVKAHVRSTVSNREDREDLIQECMMKCVEIFKKYKLDAESFVFMSKRAVRNVVKDWLRSKVVRASGKICPCMIEKMVHLDIEMVSLSCALEDLRKKLNPLQNEVLNLLLYSNSIAYTSERLGLPKRMVRKVSDQIRGVICQK